MFLQKSWFLRIHTELLVSHAITDIELLYGKRGARW